MAGSAERPVTAETLRAVPSPVHGGGRLRAAWGAVAGVVRAAGRVRVGAELAANLLGLVGLALVVVGLGGLTGDWWVSVLAGGVVAVYVSFVMTRAAVPPVALRPAPATRRAS